MACTYFKDTCDEQSISPEDMLRLLIRTNSDGCPALAIKPGTAASPACTPHVTCLNKELSWKDLFFLIVDIDSGGCPVIRTIE